MPTQGEKWGATGGFNQRTPKFSWWATGTLIALLAVVLAMVLDPRC